MADEGGASAAAIEGEGPCDSAGSGGDFGMRNPPLS